MAEAADKLVKKASDMEKVFFTNSGTEAIEGALKAARKVCLCTSDGRCRPYEIIAMNHSFHGRSMGALSVTGNAHYRKPFEPLIGGVKFCRLIMILKVLKAQIDRQDLCYYYWKLYRVKAVFIRLTEEFLEGRRRHSAMKRIFC